MHILNKELDGIMNILTLDNITQSYTERLLFDKAFFSLNDGEKVGIIGINGTGKSTLLKIMAGIETPDEGTVTMANHVIARYLPQHPEFEDGVTALQAVMNNNKGHNGEWDIEGSAKSMLNELGITDYDVQVNLLSGGQRKRVALAAMLLSDADILLLDEPTNHLDSFMTEWLENYLKNYRGAVVMVTHDRYFLDSVSNRIVEIDKGNIYSYQTNYSGFLKLKTEREEMEQSTEKKKQNLLRNELKWVMRGAQARSTKQKARLERYEELKNRKRSVSDGTVEMSSVESRLGKTTVELHNICKSYGDRKLIDDFTYIFLKNDRVGFVGENGCGKTTLMKIATGMLEPDSGEVITGQTVKIGYYAQEIETEDTGKISYMDSNKSVIDYIRDTAEYVRTKDGLVSASVMLDRFLFPPEKQYSLIGKLSGGEKRRLNLLRVLMEAPNVLVLDEPTNDLDITTLTILEDYLDSFSGIVIVVSHDRYFLDRTVSRIFSFEKDGNIKQYEGGYSDYKLVKEFEETPDTETLVKAEKPSNVKIKDKKLKFTWQEQKDFETIEDDIAALEDKIEGYEARMLANASDFAKLNQLTKDKEAAEQLLEEKMDRWMYLSELDEKIKNQ